MDWQQFTLALHSLDPEAVEAILLHHGAHSITLTDAADEPVLEPAPGETPLWNDTRITGLFSPDADLDALADDLVHTLGLDALPAHRVESLVDREWEREWLRDFGPMKFGNRLWICPGDSVTGDADAVVVRLDPGLAFGTGTHPTTAMCLEWLDSLDLRGKTILDYGCGSGVLAIAALKLGCTAATAMDIDPQAEAATRSNARRNGIDICPRGRRYRIGHLQVVGSDDAIDGSFDVVVANILAGPLTGLVESLTTRLSSAGKLALSGILSDQVDAVEGAYAAKIAFDRPILKEQGDRTWVCLSGNRR
ncbi:MAG: 50S ribosomal protein L11 methyltransferase [Woeseiaceae bacterium]